MWSLPAKGISCCRLPFRIRYPCYGWNIRFDRDRSKYLQGLIRTTEALIYRSMLEDKPSPWLLYKRSWGQYKLIGKTPQRPTATDLELALYNASASESPITKGMLWDKKHLPFFFWTKSASLGEIGILIKHVPQQANCPLYWFMTQDRLKIYAKNKLALYLSAFLRELNYMVNCLHCNGDCLCQCRYQGI